VRSNLLSSIEIASASPRNDNEESLNLGLKIINILSLSQPHIFNISLKQNIKI